MDTAHGLRIYTQNLFNIVKCATGCRFRRSTLSLKGIAFSQLKIIQSKKGVFSVFTQECPDISHISHGHPPVWIGRDRSLILITN